MAHYNSQPLSPELKHPVPTHPAYIPEPPTTPNSPQGYQRFLSSPAPQQQPPGPGLHAPYAGAPGYGQPAYMRPAFGAPAPGGQMGHGVPPVPPPDFAAWGVNDATAALGMQLGQSVAAAGQNYVQQNFGRVLPGAGALKHHFNVSNSYVINKLRIVLFPWRHPTWTRQLLRDEQGTAVWVPPRDDINSPDLYIPSMAFVTYVLLAGLASGLQERFHPEILGISATKAFAVLALEYAFVKLGCYFLNIQGTSQSFDLVAYGGYKFIGVIITVLTSLLNFGWLLYMLVFAYTFGALGFFLLRSLRLVFLHDPNTTASQAGTVNQAQRKRRITFLFLVALSQLLWMFVLVRV